MNGDDLKNLLIPTRGQIIVCAAIATVLFGFTFRDVLVGRLLNRQISTGLTDVSPYLSTSYAIQLGHVSSLALTDFLVKAVFWAGVGLIAYIIFLAISNAVIEARNEVVVEAEYTNRGQPQARFRKLFQQLALAAVLIVLVLISASVLVPLWLASFEAFLNSLPNVGSVIFLIVAYIGVMANIYGVWTLGQIVFAIE